MADYSRKETAVRAGVPIGFMDRLVELGVLVPGAGDRFSAGDARRAGTVQTLEASGIPVQDVADTLKSGALSLSFLDSPIYERFAPYTAETFADLSARTGVPVELLAIIREAMGAALPSPTDFVREDELAIVPFLEMQVANGFQPIATERLLRVHGDSLRRMAETESGWWRSEVIAPGLAAGKSPEEAVNPDYTEELTRRLGQSVLAIYGAQQAHAWTANIIDGFVLALERAGLSTRLDHPPAMCFLDITGYTRLTQERGDAAAAELAGTLSRLVQRTSIAHAGRPVKWLGDGVMFIFPEPGSGVAAALEMVAGVADAGLPPAHVGLHAGPVIFQDGDFFGQTVNVASRIAEYARPGEVLVTQAVVDSAAQAGTTGVGFTDIGPVELKGVAGALHLLAAHRA